MKIMKIYNTVYAFATQRNATQRNAYQNYILNNNFKFYIFQFFRTLEFLSGSIRFAKTQFAIISHCHYEGNARSNLFSVDCFVSLAMTKFFNGHYEDEVRDKVGQSPSNPNLIKFDFYNLISLINKFYTKWIASLIPFVRNDKFKICNDNFNYAFSCALKNKFEIISQLNYGFCYKNYFFNLNQVFRNSYDFGERFGRNLNYGFEKNCNGSFGKNYFGNCNFGFDFRNEICGIGNNLAGFLFNRKTKKINLCQRFSVGEGEQK